MARLARGSANSKGGLAELFSLFLSLFLALARCFGTPEPPLGAAGTQTLRGCVRASVGGTRWGGGWVAELRESDGWVQGGGSTAT